MQLDQPAPSIHVRPRRPMGPEAPWHNLEHLLQERRLRQATAGWHRAPALRPILSPLRRARRALDALWTAQQLRLIAGAGRLLGTQRIVRPLPEFRGDFELDLRSDVTRNLLLGRFERALVPLVEAAIGHGDVIDVGANAGLYTVLAARLVGEQGRVLAVEPAPSILDLLKANITRNRLHNVLLFEGVAASERGWATLHVMEGNEEYASLGGGHHPHAPRRALRRIEVPAETLDALTMRHALQPAFIKIDTEGAEGLVLQGATAVLSLHRPVVLSELDDRLLRPLGWDAERVRGLLFQLGYRIYDALTGSEQLPGRVAAPYIGEIVALPSPRP